MYSARMEQKTQNKLAIIAILFALYLGFFTIVQGLPNPDSLEWVKFSTALVLIGGALPLFYFFLYLLFIPQRYKQKNKNIFSIEFKDYQVTDSDIDHLFDKGANVLVTTYISGFSYVVSYSISINIFKSGNLLFFLALYVGNFLISWVILKFIVHAKRADDYMFGDGFIKLFKAIFIRK